MGVLCVKIKQYIIFLNKKTYFSQIILEIRKNFCNFATDNVLT